MQWARLRKRKSILRDACMPPVGAYRKAAAPTTRLREGVGGGGGPNFQNNSGSRQGRLTQARPSS